jgi:hypothetical protein
MKSASITAFTAALVCAASAAAAPMAWQGTLSFEFVSGIADAAVSGGGSAGVARSSGTGLRSLTIWGGITGAVRAPVTDPDVAATLRSVMATVTLGGGTLSPFQPLAPFGDPQLHRGVLPVRGLLRLCFLLDDCSIGPVLRLTRNEGNTGLGAGGLLTIGVGGTGWNVSVEAAPWTVGTATLPLRTEGGATVAVQRAGFVHGPLSFTGSTAREGGVLQLVTPIAVTSQDGQPFASFAVLDLRLIPEPGPLVLLGAGVLGMLALAMTRGP